MLDLAEQLVQTLKDNKLTLATAESCTGGKLAAAIVSVPGASEVFYEGLVTYSNESKISRLGVDPAVLEKRGAVSFETALNMAGALVKGPVDVGISTTGIAGPGGGTPEKPVGLVYIAVCFRDRIGAETYRFTGNREEIRAQATTAALKQANRYIREYL